MFGLKSTQSVLIIVDNKESSINMVPMWLRKPETMTSQYTKVCVRKREIFVPSSRVFCGEKIIYEYLLKISYCRFEKIFVSIVLGKTIHTHVCATLLMKR